MVVLSCLCCGGICVGGVRVVVLEGLGRFSSTVAGVICRRGMVIYRFTDCFVGNSERAADATRVVVPQTVFCS